MNMIAYLKNIIDKGLYHLTIIAIAFSITITISGLLWYELPYIKLFLIIALLYAVLSVMTYNLRYFFVSSMSIIIILVLGFAVTLIFDRLSHVLLVVEQHITLYSNSITQGILLPAEYQMIPEIIIGIAACVIVIFISRYKYSYIGLLLLGLTTFLAASFIRGYHDTAAYYVFIGGIITNYYYAFYRKNIENKKKYAFYQLAANAFIFSLILVFLVGSLYRSNPRPLLFIYDMGQALEEYIDNIKKRNEAAKEGKDNQGSGEDNGSVAEEEEVTVSFDSNEELKAKVEPINNAIMYVFSDNPTYLRGSTCNIFDGKEWSNTTNYKHDMSDRKEHIEGLRWLIEKYTDKETKNLGDNDIIKTFFYDEKVSVIYQNIATKTLFTPMTLIAVYDMNGTHSSDVFDFSEGNIASFNEELIKDFGYSFKYIKPKFGMKAFEQLIRKTEKGLYEAFEASSYQNDLMNKADYIRQEYMQLPDSITDRTMDLAKTITKDYDNDYDKARAIESYLKSHFNYTYSTSLPENGDDIIDHFLFETQEGFCTYNASAMIMMLRSVDIPARYVKGFVSKGATGDDGSIRGEELKKGEELEMDNESEADNPNKSRAKTNQKTVTGWDAHAWVEVYLEGFGWISFEPTSGFQIERVEQDIEAIQPLPLEDLEIKEVYDKEQVEEAKKRIPITYVMIILLAGLLISLIVFVIRKFEKSKQDYMLGSTRNKVIKIYKKILMLIHMAGYKKESHLTIREYVKKINGALDSDNYSLMDLTKIYELACYSNLKIEDEQLEMFEGYYQVMKRAARKKTNFIRVGFALFIYNLK